MIILVNPRATRPTNRRFPLSVMAIGAALPAGHRPGRSSTATCRTSIHRRGDRRADVERQAGEPDPVRAVAITVMPGPQLVSAVPLAKAVKARFPDVPIIWGGNFGSLYPGPVLNAPYVDWLVRGQGEQPSCELLDVIAASAIRRPSPDLPSARPTARTGSARSGRWLGPGRTAGAAVSQDRRRRLSAPDLARPALRASTRPRSAAPTAAISAA